MVQYRYIIARSINDFSKNEWNYLVKNSEGSVFHSFEWLKTFEISKPANYRPFYVVVFKNDQLIGGTAVFETIYCPRLELYKKNLLNNKSMNLNHPMMISHSLYGQYSQVLSIEDRRIVIKFILDAIHNISILQDVPIYGFPMIHESDKILLEETKQTNFVTKYFNSVCRLYIHWENFDEYLHSFNNKKRRKISKLIRECEKQGLTCKNDISIDEIAQLAKKTCSHHDSPLFYSKSFLECIFKEMKQYIKIFSANYENRSIGVLVCFSFNSVLTPWLVGLDYDLSKELNPYNYLYVKIIEFSINNQIKLIEFGRGTFYIKSKYGCEMEKLFISLKGTSESLDQLVEMWCNEIERSSLDYLNKYKIKYNKSMTRTA